MRPVLYCRKTRCATVTLVQDMGILELQDGCLYVDVGGPQNQDVCVLRVKREECVCQGTNGKPI